MALGELFVFLLILGSNQTFSATFNIGGIFDIQDLDLEVAFLDAINKVNNNRSILPQGTRLVAQAQQSTADSLQASKIVCELTRNGVAAIFGPQSLDSWMHVQSMCNFMEIPHFSTRWNYYWERNGHNAINIYPDGPSLSKAYLSLIRHWQWKSFAVIYQEHEGLIKLNDLFHSQRKVPYNGTAIQLPSDGEFHDALRIIKLRDFTNIIVDCDAATAFTVLEQALQIGIMTDRHHYLITNLDFHTINSKSVSYSGAKITSVRLVDSDKIEVKEALDSMEKIKSKMIGEIVKYKHMKTEAALMFDAVYILANGLKELTNASHSGSFDPKLDCELEEKWMHGDSLFNYINSMMPFTGLSGLVGLSKGYRKTFDLEIMSLTSSGSLKIGHWKSWTSKPEFYSTSSEIIIPEIAENPISLKNALLKIKVIITPPYVMHADSKTELIGNKRYEGYCIDLLDELSERAHFNYTISEVPPGAYPSLLDLIENKTVHMSLGDITITAERQERVDFTTPFLNLGINILFKAPEKGTQNLLAFLSPFSNSVWILMGLTYLAVSGVIFALARLTPYEWDNPYPCIQDPDEVINSYTWLNSLWFTIGSLMQQGSDIAPKAASTRAIAAIWWFFTLIMVSSYTANLAAFLTVVSLETPIKNVNDLANQNKIKYGCAMSGSTRKFFNNSQVPLFQQMFKVMESENGVYLENNEVGKQKVRQGNYAFLIESSSSEYITERNCDLKTVGDLLDSKGYGIAMQKNSSYRAELSAIILDLQEKGRLSDLKTKWWKQKKGGGQCKEKKESTTEALNLNNVGGIFVVLIGGGCLAIIVAIFEFWWVARKRPITQRKPMAKAMLDEVVMAVNCKGTKEVIKNKDEEPPSEFPLNDEYY